MIDSGLGKHFHTFPVNLWCAHSPCSSPARHFVAIFPACSAWGYHPTTATLRWSHCFLSNDWEHLGLPSGKRLHNYGKSPFLMGKSTISMVIFNSYVSHYQRVDKSFLPSSGPVGPVKPTAFVRVCPKQTLNLDEAGAGLYPQLCSQDLPFRWPWLLMGFEWGSGATHLVLTNKREGLHQPSWNREETMNLYEHINHRTSSNRWHTTKLT